MTTTLNIEAIEEAIKQCKDLMPQEVQALRYKPFSMCGMDITSVPVRRVAKVKLGDAAPVSDEFRAEFNQWLIDKFGTRDITPIKSETAYMFGNRIVMRADDVVRLTNFA